ncbi:hypothetical protein, partial [Mycobacterium sp. E342]|uniref:hypothetical protein n=1 Tax=Mycobacterium sp. E342 TaxID=1834147 RepID=UPI001E474DB7
MEAWSSQAKAATGGEVAPGGGLDAQLSFAPTISLIRSGAKISESMASGVRVGATVVVTLGGACVVLWPP